MLLSTLSYGSMTTVSIIPSVLDLSVVLPDDVRPSVYQSYEIGAINYESDDLFKSNQKHHQTKKESNHMKFNQLHYQCMNGQVGERSQECRTFQPARQPLLFHVMSLGMFACESKKQDSLGWRGCEQPSCRPPTNHSSLPSLRCRHQMQELLHSTHSFAPFLDNSIYSLAPPMDIR